MISLTIKNGIKNRYSEDKVVYKDNENLTIQITLPQSNNSEFIFCYENNAEKKRLKIVNGAVEISNLTLGVFKSKIEQYIKGEFIQTFLIEDLYIISGDNQKILVPEMTEIKQQMQDLTDENKSLKEKQASEKNKFLKLFYLIYKNSNQFINKKNLSEEEFKAVFERGGDINEEI